jgi:hypothetical protein
MSVRGLDHIPGFSNEPMERLALLGGRVRQALS